MSSMLGQNVEGFRLSTDQEHVLSLHSSNPRYVSVMAILIEGPLDKRVLNRTLTKVIERNEILRTTFHYKTGANVALQVVMSANGNAPWTEIDFSHLEDAQQKEAIDRKFVEFQNSAVDLDQFPLWQASVLRLATERHVLIFGVLALCADNLTLKNFLTELARFYVSDLPASEAVAEQVQYADFS